MATIVQMKASPDRRSRPAEYTDGATILFFTGVRYVRDDEFECEEATPVPERASQVHAVEEVATLAFI